MRTTLDIDDDVLLAVKTLAKQTGRPMGRILSEFARQSLTRTPSTGQRGGVPVFPRQADAGVVTLELVNRLRDEGP